LLLKSLEIAIFHLFWALVAFSLLNYVIQTLIWYWFSIVELNFYLSGNLDLLGIFLSISLTIQQWTLLVIIANTIPYGKVFNRAHICICNNCRRVELTYSCKITYGLCKKPCKVCSIKELEDIKYQVGHLIVIPLNGDKFLLGLVLRVFTITKFNISFSLLNFELRSWFNLVT
jgi:hypothetical protein